MFGRKKNQVRLELTMQELRILRKIMLYFRNKVAAENGPTEDIDAVIVKLCL